MANTDFFDDDLMKQRDAARRLKLGQDDSMATVGSNVSSSDEVPVRPVSDFNLTRMAKHKNEVDENVAQAVTELERLRKRQEDLEREKRELEELRRKQEEYERGKREMVERFGQSLVTLEKDELQAERLAELLGQTRKRFREMLNEIQAVNEAIWPEERFGDELNKALTLIEDARMEYNKSMSKVDAIAGGDKKGSGDHQPVVFENLPHEEEKPFGFWIKVGFAVSLPVVICLVAITVVVLMLHLNGQI